MVQYEKEILLHLNIPSIPKKKWDGKSSFWRGVAVIETQDGSTAYAVATFNAESDEAPRITKVFSVGAFVSYGDIFIVPNYMNDNVDTFDLPDDKSKQAAQSLIEEAKEMEMEGVDEPQTEIPEHEYFFPFITNDEEAQAYIRNYNRERGRRKGAIPSTHESIVLKLAAIYAEQQNKKK